MQMQLKRDIENGLMRDIKFNIDIVYACVSEHTSRLREGGGVDVRRQKTDKLFHNVRRFPIALPVDQMLAFVE